MSVSLVCGDGPDAFELFRVENVQAGCRDWFLSDIKDYVYYLHFAHLETVDQVRRAAGERRLPHLWSAWGGELAWNPSENY